MQKKLRQSPTHNYSPWLASNLLPPLKNFGGFFYLSLFFPAILFFSSLELKLTFWLKFEFFFVWSIYLAPLNRSVGVNATIKETQMKCGNQKTENGKRSKWRLIVSLFFNIRKKENFWNYRNWEIGVFFWSRKKRKRSIEMIKKNDKKKKSAITRKIREKREVAYFRRNLRASFKFCFWI